MSDFDADTLKKWLTNHDVRLRPPASPADLNELRSTYSGQVSLDLIQLYEAFDGCDQDDFEVDSFFSIWPIARGLAFVKERTLHRDYAFGDTHFSADVVLCSLLEPAAPVRWFDGLLAPATSLGAFFETLTSGRLWAG